MAGPKRPWLAAGGLLTLAAVCGCGNTYRPVVTPVNPIGPPPQPSVLVAVVSQQNAPGATPDPKVPGVATILDFSGDSILAQAYVGPGPIGLTMDTASGSGYTLNIDGTLSTFPVSSTLMTKLVAGTTLLPGTTPVNLLSTQRIVYLADSTNNQIDVLTGSPISLKQAIPVGLGPITVVGNGGGQRVYAISQGLPFGTCGNPAQSQNGTVSTIEASTNTVSNTIPVGVCPVYGIVTADTRRVFILNRGSGTVSVIDGQTNQAMPTIDLNTSGGGGPVYAEIYQNSSILVTANYDSSTVSFIDISTDVFGNNSPTFGRVLATVPVGLHPASVTVLQDGSRAYTANQGDGTVSIIDMTSFKVKKTIRVMDMPRSVLSVTNALVGKVYVISPSSPLVTIIRTDTDTVSATVQLPGNVVELHTTAQVAGGTNTVNVSRTSGSGAP